MFAARALLVVVAVAAIAGAGWFVWLRGEAEPGMPEPARTETKPEPGKPEPVVPVVAPLPTPESAGIPEAKCIAYPDGTRLPPLNGVTEAPRIDFHRSLPFTKVVRKERDARTGLEWYVHENGARSTTRLMWRNGVQEAVSEVEMPAPSQPLVDEK